MPFILHNRYGVFSLVTGAFALAVAVYALNAPAMNDGDLLTPGYFHSIVSFFSVQQTHDMPAMSASSVVLLLDTEKRLVASVMATLFAIFAFLTGMVSRRLCEHSMPHAAGMLAGVSSIALLSPWAGLLAALLHLAALAVVAERRSPHD